MGAVLPGAPQVPIYGNTSVSQNIVEAYAMKDIQKVMDILDFAETLHTQITGAATATPTADSTADFYVPAGSTAVILSVVCGAEEIPQGATVDVFTQRYINGSAAAFVSGIANTWQAPALPVASYAVRADVTGPIRGALLWNPSNGAAIGLRTLANGVGAATGMKASLIVRAAIFSGNPFNAQIQV